MRNLKLFLISLFIFLSSCTYQHVFHIETIIQTDENKEEDVLFEREAPPDEVLEGVESIFENYC